MPERLAGLGVKRGECAVVIAEENQPAGGCEQSTPGFSRPGLFVLPNNLSRLRIDSAQIFVRLLGGDGPRGSTIERFALLPPLRVLAKDVAFLERDQIEQAGARMICRGHP